MSPVDVHKMVFTHLAPVFLIRTRLLYLLKNLLKLCSMHINAFNLLLTDLLLFDIHQHGNEGRLSEKYAAAMQNLSSDDIR